MSDRDRLAVILAARRTGDLLSRHGIVLPGDEKDADALIAAGVTFNMTPDQWDAAYEAGRKDAADRIAEAVRGLLSHTGMTHGPRPGGDLLTRAAVLALLEKTDE